LRFVVEKSFLIDDPHKTSVACRVSVAMGTSDDLMIPRRVHARLGTRATFTRLHHADWVTGGGPNGNERLTTVTGVILFVPPAIVGFTIPQLRQFIWLHLFAGLLMIGPVALEPDAAVGQGEVQRLGRVHEPPRSPSSPGRGESARGWGP
jgi:hypothetical protein